MRTFFVWALLIGALSASAENIGDSLEGLVKYTMPSFPLGLRGVKSGDGEAVVALTINSAGKVVDSVALLATNSDFARAALQAVNTWEFAPSSTPAMLRREVVDFSFRRNGVVTSLSHAEAAKDAFVSKAYYQITTLQQHDLTRELQRTSGAMPEVPSAVINEARQQAVVVNHIIDTEGRVRVPVVLNTAHVALAQTVLDAVANWRYIPPVHNNKPVLVEVTQTLVLAPAQ